jgi:hypothetical protein
MDANFSALSTALVYKGTFDASAGYPSTPVVGDAYVNTVEGTISTVLYKVDDVIFYDGVAWKRTAKQIASVGSTLLLASKLGAL